MITCKRCSGFLFHKLSRDSVKEVSLLSEAESFEPFWVIEAYRCFYCEEEFTVAREIKIDEDRQSNCD